MSQFAGKLGRIATQLGNAVFGVIESTRRWCGCKPVHSISTEELRLLLETNPESIVIVDVRSDQERAISQIPKAVAQRDYEANPSSYSGKTVIPYCTIGGRSYLFARKLAAADTPTKNYRDSVLGWCRANGPLETPDGQPTKAVHTYWKIFEVPREYDAKS